MLDRTIPPALKAIDAIQFVAPKKHAINAHVPLYHMQAVPNETTRVDFYFDAGKCKETNGIPGIVNGLLLSGTNSMSATDIQNRISGLGGFYESGISVENSVMSVYCLRENALEIIETVVHAISEVAFFEEEVDQLLAERKQQLTINLEKVSYQAQQVFQKQLFASNARYSSVMELSDFDQVTRETLKNFHQKHYLNGLSKMVVVGDLDATAIATIIDQCQPMAMPETSAFERHIEHTKGAFISEKDGAMQCAIRIGRILFNKTHEDYLDFLIVHTILGDYFGSRLMSNIREDKGYTYGIGTMLAELRETGYFMAATEVRKDVRDATLIEIKREFERLQNELVPDEELDLVKNYMIGQLLKSADGPYAMTDLFLSAEMHGEGLEIYNRALHAIENISPKRIQELANKYLCWDDMTIVAFG